MAYPSEAKFGHALDEALRTKGYDVHNIQTPTTERGCPDRFVQKGGLSAWIELKNIHTSVKHYQLPIPYRPGQQAWLFRNHKHGGRSFTAIAGEDGILFFKNEGILQDKVYIRGKWPELFVSHIYSKTIDEWLMSFAYREE